MKALTAGYEDLGGDQRGAGPLLERRRGRHWLVHEQRYERMLAPFTDHLLTAAAIGGADRVLDIGCGTGSTTRAAGRVAIQGEALGLDLSAAMLRQAARRAQRRA